MLLYGYKLSKDQVPSDCALGSVETMPLGNKWARKIKQEIYEQQKFHKTQNSKNRIFDSVPLTYKKGGHN